MCGRFTISKTEEELEKRFGADFYTKVLEARYNIAPTRRTPVITADDPDHIQLFHWGLVPFWAKDTGIGARMINARVETVGEKPAFRRAFRRRRCLVLADGWYEWKPAASGEGPSPAAASGRRAKAPPKQPYRIARRDREAFAMAGLWETWNPDGMTDARDPARDWHSFTIITRPALPSLEAIHDRMPALLTRAHERYWLAPPAEGAEEEDMRQLLIPYPEEALEAYPVSTAVNNARHEAPELLERVDPDQPTEGLFA